MRRCTKLLLVVSTLVALSSSSWATMLDSYLPGNVSILMKFANYDVGTRYDIDDADGPYTNETDIDDIVTQTGPAGVVAGSAEDSWGLLWLTDIYRDGIEDEAHRLWRTNDDDYGDFEVSGLFWGGVDSFLDQNTVGGTVTQNIGASGFHVALWEDTATNFSAAAGPGARLNVAGNLPFYAGVTDGTLIWTLDTVPGFVKAFDTSATRDFLADYSLTGTQVTGSGGFWSTTSTIVEGPNSYTGALNWLLGTLPDGVNLKTTFTNLTPPAGQGWDVKSNDPSEGVTTPELSSGALMLLGMVPMGIGWWRRRKA